MMKACSTCGTLNPDDAIFCENCGADLRQDTNSLEGSNANGKTCPNCGTQNDPDVTFCTNCGFAFQSTVNMGDSQPIQQGPSQPKKSPVWPWVLGGFVLLLVAGGGYYYYTQVGANQNKTATSSSSSKKASSHRKSAEEKQIEAENSSLKAAQKSDDKEKRTNATKTVTLSDSQREAVIKQFTDWAGNQARKGNMAVSAYYFNHGSAGQGDWYADTPDGKVQVEDNGHPGASAFKIHAIGGFVFYTAMDGQIGIDDTLGRGTTAQGYSVNMNFDKPVSKYLLADNGVVYELQLGNGTTVALSDGFSELTDDGQKPDVPSKAFIVSKDKAAQTEFSNALKSVE